jgi:uncharacterized membrane protein YfcA/uncharacterized membrane protein YedE/YeeE
MIAVASALSLLVGLTLGLLGGGGSILMLPLLVYVAGSSPSTAVTLSLLVVTATSAAALWPHARAGHVQWRAGIPFGAAGMAGAYAGGLLSPSLPAWSILLGFGAVMLWAAFGMLRRGQATTIAASQQEGRSSMPRVLVQGAGIGVIAGLVGAGGGFLVVPALVVLGGLPMRTAIGTSLLVITMQSAAGSVAHLQQGMALDWLLAAWTGLPALVGSLVGARLSSHVPQERLRRGFAWLVLVLGVLVSIEPLWTLAQLGTTWTTPWLRALVGGVVIGSAAALLWLLGGRISGVSGIVGGLFSAAARPGERRWRGGFLLGLVVGGAVMSRLVPSAFALSPTSLPLVLVAGALVGIGTTLANGCTSGHGVCGVSRLSPRSVAATITFMGAGMVTVALMRVLGASS